MHEDKLPLLRVSDLKTYYPVKKGLFSRTVDFIKAVDGVSFDIYSGETLGLVGESGSGKSSIGRTIVRLEQATEGRIYFDGKDITKYGRSEMKPLRRDMGMIFQDPYSSLNPKLTVGELLEEPLLVNGIESSKTVAANVKGLLDKVGLPQQALKKYPHEFSGGQRQRIGIARVLALQPKLIVCDEPVSALDVSIQAQILNLLQDLQKEYKISYLFIGHGLGAVSYISERIAVMYMGKIVEIGTREKVFSNPKHPYTRFLLEAYPIQHPKYRNQSRKILQGEIPSVLGNTVGCNFSSRCPYASERCLSAQPLLTGKEGHLAACILNDDYRTDVENS